MEVLSTRLSTKEKAPKKGAFQVVMRRKRVFFKLKKPLFLGGVKGRELILTPKGTPF